MTRFVVAIVMTVLAGCASPSYFVDGSLQNVSVAQIERLERPRPTQLLFSFATRGLVDTQVSETLEAEVARIVAASGLFTTANETPAEGGAILNVVIDAHPATDEEVARGVAAGLTLGVVGSTRRDPVVCKMDYIPAPGSEPLTTTVQHAIYIPLGIVDSRPKGIILAKSRIDAQRIVTRQSVTAGLQQLSQSAAFRKEAQTP
jgi:hypothetical protein